jgi:phage recombination protein Bet
MSKALATRKGMSVLQSMAERLKCDPEELKKVVKVSMTSAKDDQGNKRPMTDEEFTAFMIVANSYGLNPMTKEITAFASEKGGGIVPVVSTDGWTRLGVNHPNYLTHFFRQSETMVTMKGAKPCPEWMEVVIRKKDGSEVPIREYLDEAFRDVSFRNPWQTHTKRMLRHKTKIQGFREAFGFGGIYDEDEAHRIIEAEVVESTGKPETKEPEKLPEVAHKETVESKPAANAEFENKPKVTEAKEERKDPPKENKQPEKAKPAEAKDEIMIGVKEALEVPTGKIIPAVHGWLMNVNQRTPKNKTLTEYTITDENNENVMMITVWGTWDQSCVTGDHVRFNNVTVSAHYRNEGEKSFGSLKVMLIEKGNE